MRARTDLDLEGFQAALQAPEEPPGASWRAESVALEPGQEAELRALCAPAGIQVTDPLDHQLPDLAAVRLPAGSPEERERWMAQALETAGGRDAYGRWVHLPWRRMMVHLLAPEDYFDVVTDRNRDKINREEQRLLRSRRVGVAGLSVGGEAAFTLAQEHLCGTLVLADFDALDLSNLNRLGTGVHALGQNKAVLLARRIAEVDPWLEVVLHPEGVTGESLDAFMDGLDLLVEECDGLAMKWTMREEARRRGIDIIFAGDERGFLSLEPYGAHPDLLPFHGLLDGPQPPRSSFDSPLAFMKELTVWLGGWDAISDRSRNSLARLGTELGGYPQLASEARYAAGQLGHVARRLLLGERLPPFVGHLDLDELLPTTPQEHL